MFIGSFWRVRPGERFGCRSRSLLPVLAVAILVLCSFPSFDTDVRHYSQKVFRTRRVAGRSRSHLTSHRGFGTHRADAVWNAVWPRGALRFLAPVVQSVKLDVSLAAIAVHDCLNVARRLFGGVKVYDKGRSAGSPQ